MFTVNKEKGVLNLVEVAEGFSVDDIRVCTGCDFEVSSNLKKMGQVEI